MEPLFMTCFCKKYKFGSHCQGYLQIMPDTVEGTRVFMVTVVDTRGNDEGSMWLDQEQLQYLIKSLSGMYETYFGSVENKGEK